MIRRRGAFANFGERAVAAAIEEHLRAGDGTTRVLANVIVPTGQGPREVDFVVVGPLGITAIEVKHWQSPVRFAGQGGCVAGGRQRTDPRPKTKLVAQALYAEHKTCANPLVLFHPDGTDVEVESSGDPDLACPVRTTGAGLRLVFGPEREELVQRKVWFGPWRPLGAGRIAEIADGIWGCTADPEQPQIVRDFQIVHRSKSDLFEEYSAYQLLPDGSRGEGVRLQRHEIGYTGDPQRHARDVAAAHRNYQALVRLEKVPGVPTPRAFFSDLDDDSILWTAYRHVKGVPLRRCAEGLFRIQTIIAIARTLEACHAEGVVHRALSPESLIITERGLHPVLLHFDFSRVAGQSTLTSRVTQQLRDRRYTAPEVRDAPSAATPAADVYSLGVIATELLTGRELESGDPAEAAAAARTLSSAPIRPILQRMVAAPVNERYRGMTDLLRDLVNIV